jgi:hypothetical protein
MKDVHRQNDNLEQLRGYIVRYTKSIQAGALTSWKYTGHAPVCSLAFTLGFAAARFFGAFSDAFARSWTAALRFFEPPCCFWLSIRVENASMCYATRDVSTTRDVRRRAASVVALTPRFATSITNLGGRGH